MKCPSCGSSMFITTEFPKRKGFQWRKCDNCRRVEIRCAAHPAYRAILKPRVPCRPCDILYKGRAQ